MATAEEMARLAAGAQGGMAGVDSYDRAQREITASRDAALASLQGEVNAVGGDQRVMDALRGQVERPVARVLDTLASGKAFDEGYQAHLSRASEGYRSAVDQATPLIKGEVDRELQMQLARIRASGSGGGGGGGGGGGFGDMSDSEARNYALGLARMQREMQSQVASAQHNAKTAQEQLRVTQLQGASRTARSAANTAARRSLPAPKATKKKGWSAALNPIRQVQATTRRANNALAGGGMMTNPLRVFDRAIINRNPQYQQAQSAYKKADRARFSADLGSANAQNMRMAALQQLSDPRGDVASARDLAIGLGMDPGRAYGLLGPNEEAAAMSDFNALSKPGPMRTMAGVTLPVEQAAQQSGISQSMARKALGYSWQPTDANGEPLVDSKTGEDAAPINVYQDALSTLRDLANQGIDVATAANMMSSLPYAKRYPRTVQLAVAAAQPLFGAKMGVQVPQQSYADQSYYYGG